MPHTHIQEVPSLIHVGLSAKQTKNFYKFHLSLQVNTLYRRRSPPSEFLSAPHSFTSSNVI
jgi:hypothetical protein